MLGLSNPGPILIRGLLKWMSCVSVPRLLKGWLRFVASLPGLLLGCCRMSVTFGRPELGRTDGRNLLSRWRNRWLGIRVIGVDRWTCSRKNKKSAIS